MTLRTDRDRIVKPLVEFDCQFRSPSGFELDARFETSDRVTAICGDSGSGKTTLLSLIAGLLRPERGRITLGGTTVTDTTGRIDLAPEQRRVGYLFQDECLFPHLTIRQNITYGTRIRGQRTGNADRLIEILELKHLLERFPRSLSGGQRQRVALARAMAVAPDILLLDEPITAVEEDLRNRIVDLIERVIEETRVPTLLVSHNRDLVRRLATRRLDLADGRMV